MNRNFDAADSADLSLEPQELNLQPRAIVCPKCQHKRTASDTGPEWQCPNCGIAYIKAAPPSADVVHKVSSTSGARGRREADHDEFETDTPSALSLSLTGRIGRLRYLAYWWPTMLLSGFLMLLAIRPGTVDKTSTIVLVVLLCGLWMCVSLRLMALRMHDLNQSSKWLLVAIFLPGVFFALGKPQLGAMCSGLFWIGGLMLLLVPGTEGDNTYGPPPGANTTLVKVGAGIILFFMVLGIIGNIKMIRAGKLHSPLASAQVQPGSGDVSSGAAAETQNAGQLPTSDWVGSWQGLHSALRVDERGNAVFFHIDGSFSVRAIGPLRILDDTRVSIGAGANATVLKLAVPPHMEGAGVKMMLDGVELVKR